MKTVKITLLTGLVLLLLGNPLVAQSFTMEVDGGRAGEMLTLRLNDLDQQRTELNIIDMDGKTWLEKYLWKEDAYAAGLDLRYLPEGDYLLTVRNRSGRSSTPFRIQHQTVMPFYEKDISTGPKEQKRLVRGGTSPEGQLIARIQPQADEKAIDVRLANLRGQALRVKLLSLQGLPVYEDFKPADNGYAARLNLEEAGHGRYFLYLRSESSALIQFLSIDANGIHLKQAYSLETAAGKSIILASR